jgi:hypothetical protein
MGAGAVAEPLPPRNDERAIALVILLLLGLRIDSACDAVEDNSEQVQAQD